MVKKYLLLSMGVLLYSLPAHASVNDDLWMGILTTRPSVVERAIAQGADLHCRFGRYGDTPLMAAVRLYSHTLQARVVGESHKVTAQKAGASIVFGSGIGALVYYFSRSIYESVFVALSLSSLFYTLNAITSSSLTMMRTARIAEILIRASDNINERNKEGLTALDILKSYYPYAYQLGDETWYKFVSMLNKKNEQQQLEGTKKVTFNVSIV